MTSLVKNRTRLLILKFSRLLRSITAILRTFIQTIKHLNLNPLSSRPLYLKNKKTSWPGIIKMRALLIKSQNSQRREYENKL